MEEIRLEGIAQRVEEIGKTMLAPSNAKVTPLYEKDKELFLEVKIAIVKACTHLRDRELEKRLMAAILKIRNTHYPMINEALMRLLELQAELMPIESKLDKFQQSGMQDPSFAPTEKDREEHLKLQANMTAVVQNFSENFMKQYSRTDGRAEGSNEPLYLSSYKTNCD